MRDPATVASIGSCITRDSFNSRFNPGYKEHFTSVLHQNQSSLIALMNRPMTVSWEPLDPKMSDYDRANVRSEFDRPFFAHVVASRPDYLVLDFFGDVHFGVVRTPEGDYVTDNRWKIQRTTWYRDQQAAGHLSRMTLLDDTEAYLQLRKAAFKALMQRIRSELPETVVVLHRGRNTNRLRLPDGGWEPLGEAIKAARFPVKRANALWARLDNIAAAHVDHVIDLRPMRAPTYRDHPWGPWYVHYVPEYYERFLHWLRQIDQSRRGNLLERRRARRALATLRNP